jgi:hypothetical protein
LVCFLQGGQGKEQPLLFTLTPFFLFDIQHKTQKNHNHIYQTHPKILSKLIRQR